MARPDAGTRPSPSRGAARTRATMTRTAVLVCLAAIALGACRPLYLPLVPDAPAPPSAVRLSDDSRLSVESGRPRLVLSLTTPGLALEEREGVWLDVQWFGPSGAQAASESRWLEAEAAADDLTFDLPADVAAAVGEWRAVVSLGGALLRQFRVDVAADPEG